MPNLVRDPVTDLTIERYKGNTFALKLIVQDSSPMPTTVSCQAKFGWEKLMDSSCQPSVSISGRVITITFPVSDKYPSVGHHEINFDGRKVIAGNLFSANNRVKAPSSMNLTVTIADGATILLTALVGGGSGGGASETVHSETPTGTLNGSNATFLSLSQFIPESVEVFISGVRLSLLDDYNTAGHQTINLIASPLPGEKLRINYTKL